MVAARVVRRNGGAADARRRRVAVGKSPADGNLLTASLPYCVRLTVPSGVNRDCSVIRVFTAEYFNMFVEPWLR